MDEPLYRGANALFVLFHVALTVLFGWLALTRPRCDRVIRRLCWLLVGFFVTGAGAHITNLWDLGPASTAQAWGFVGRAIFLLALVPLLARTVGGVRHLPTPAQYHAMIRERDDALTRKDLEARTRALFQRQLEERNAKLRVLADAQRAQIEALHHKITEAEYLEMRRRLHAIRNA